MSRDIEPRTDQIQALLKRIIHDADELRVAAAVSRTARAPNNDCYYEVETVASSIVSLATMLQLKRDLKP